MHPLLIALGVGAALWLWTQRPTLTTSVSTTVKPKLPTAASAPLTAGIACPPAKPTATALNALAKAIGLGVAMYTGRTVKVGATAISDKYVTVMITETDGRTDIVSLPWTTWSAAMSEVNGVCQFDATKSYTNTSINKAQV